MTRFRPFSAAKRKSEYFLHTFGGEVGKNVANLLAGLYAFKAINIETVIKLTNYLDDAIVYASPRH